MEIVSLRFCIVLMLFIPLAYSDSPSDSIHSSQQENLAPQKNKLSECLNSSHCDGVSLPGQTPLESAFTSKIGLGEILKVSPIQPKELSQALQENGLGAILERILPSELGSVKVALLNLFHTAQESKRQDLKQTRGLLQSVSPPSLAPSPRQGSQPELGDPEINPTSTPVNEGQSVAAKSLLAPKEIGIWPADSEFNLFQIISNRIVKVIDRLY